MKESDASVSIVNGRLIDRFAFKTNAIEWLLTIPNFGVEFDLKDSEYNDMTAGLTVKYNWNSYHKYAPVMAFNLLDIRPEFRYWYRTRKPDGQKKPLWDLDRLLKERKNPRTWRAQFVGAYLSYGNYTLKFSERGYQGQTVGFGATAGYALPMYEYKKGFIDVELGFSVGLQLATKDVFIHNPEGYYYSYVENGRTGLHLTPFPVVSELKVGFAWRSKSIMDKVKTDKEKLRVKSHYEKIKGDYLSSITAITKASYEEDLKNVKGERGMRAIMANDSLYRKGFADKVEAEALKQIGLIGSAFPDEMKNHERADLRDYVKELEVELEQLIAKAKTSTARAFEKEYAKAKVAKQKAAKAEAKSKEVTAVTPDKAAGKPMEKKSKVDEKKPAKKEKKTEDIKK